MQNMSLETHHAYFHLSLIFIHASHEDFSLWQSKMSTSRIGLSWPDRRGWTRFLAVETLPLETHEHAPKMSGEGSGVQAVQQKQIVRPFW